MRNLSFGTLPIVFALVLLSVSLYVTSIVADQMISQVLLSSFDTQKVNQTLSEFRQIVLVTIIVTVFIGVLIVAIGYVYFVKRPIRQLIEGLKSEPTSAKLIETSPISEIRELVNIIHSRTLSFNLEKKSVTREFDSLRAELFMAQDKNSRLLIELSNLSDRETQAMASEIHDELCSVQVALKRKMEFFLSEKKRGSKTGNEIRHWIDLTNEADRIARGIIGRRRSSVTEYLGLEAGLRDCIDFAKMLGEDSTHYIFVNHSECIEFVPSELHTDIVRIVRECLINATKHAKADIIKLIVTDEAPDLVYRVKDNGVGFDADDVHCDSHGLEIIKERASRSNLRFEIDSSPNGTVMTVSHTLVIGK